MDKDSKGQTARHDEDILHSERKAMDLERDVQEEFENTIKEMNIFTEGATEVLTRGIYESRLMGHNFLGTEHILLGILGECSKTDDRCLDYLTIAFKDAEVEVEAIIGRGSEFISKEAQFTPKTRRTLTIAQIAASLNGEDYIDTEHLLISLLCFDDTVACRIFENLNVNIPELRSEILKKIGIKTIQDQTAKELAETRASYGTMLISIGKLQDKPILQGLNKLLDFEQDSGCFVPPPAQLGECARREDLYGIGVAGELSVGIKILDYCAIIYLADLFDAYANDDFENWLNGIDYLCEYSLPIIINCQWIDKIDSSGLGSLVIIFKKVRDSGRYIALTGNNTIRDTVRLVRLDDFFFWENSLESAISKASKSTWGADMITAEQANHEKVELGIEDKYAEDGFL